MVEENGCYTDSFNVPENVEEEEIIKVIGVGGAGSNAVNNMYNMHVKGVNYIVCNTDMQALNDSPVPTKIQLGRTVTYGRGAGNNPARGRESANESAKEIEAILDSNAQMVFVAAGMGGGTGTGAAPVIAKMAKDRGILTIGIVTIPYYNEGGPRRLAAAEGLEEMQKSVDSLLVINSETLNQMYSDMTVRKAQAEADMILAKAAKGIANIINQSMTVNVDFADVCTTLRDGGCAMMGTGEGRGEKRAEEASMQALHSPLLNNNEIYGATDIIIVIETGEERELLTSEQGKILEYFQNRAGGDKTKNCTLIWGMTIDENITDDTLRIMVIAAGYSYDIFKLSQEDEIKIPYREEENYSDEQKREIVFEDGARERNARVEMLYRNRGESKMKSGIEIREIVPWETMTEEELMKMREEPAYERRNKL